MKKEKIQILVDYEIRYDETKPGARENIVDSALRELPISLSGASRDHGSYRCERVLSGRVVEDKK